MDRNIVCAKKSDEEGNVVPYVGTWIEMRASGWECAGLAGRSLRGNVDRNVEAGYDVPKILVVPYVGTWIEMVLTQCEQQLS